MCKFLIPLQFSLCLWLNLSQLNPVVYEKMLALVVGREAHWLVLPIQLFLHTSLHYCAVSPFDKYKRVSVALKQT